MNESLTKQLTSTADGMRLYQQERAILEVTETVCRLMEEQGVTRSELAKRINKNKSHVTQLLDGEANMTVRTISDMFGALDRAVHFWDGALEATVTDETHWTVTVECPPYDWSKGLDCFSATLSGPPMMKVPLRLAG